MSREDPEDNDLLECGMSGSHASTLERLYAWERKLNDEVKVAFFPLFCTPLVCLTVSSRKYDMLPSPQWYYVENGLLEEPPVHVFLLGFDVCKISFVLGLKLFDI